jgi:hypothetical protein
MATYLLEIIDLSNIKLYFMKKHKHLEKVDWDITKNNHFYLVFITHQPE